MAEQHQWVRVLADDFSVTVSSSSIAMHQGSHLANLLELSSSGEVRLDCDTATAREVVAVLRQGPSYVKPADARLVAAVEHQLDFLGIPLQRETAPSGEEVVWVPRNPDDYEADRLGLLTYSKATQGWANMCGRQDPFVGCRAKVSPEEYISTEYSCMTTVLRAEATGAGEDVVFVVNNAHPYDECIASMCTRVGSFTTSLFDPPPQHKVMMEAAMTAAKGNLYLLGGLDCQEDIEIDLQASPCKVPMYVYRPQLNAWFTAASPLQDTAGHPAYLFGHCLVTNQQEGMLLAMGGRLSDSIEHATHNQSLFMYDLASGKWATNPSGCCWHKANAVQAMVSAVAMDPYTVMVLSQKSHDIAVIGNLRQAESFVDLLDLRMWRWRSGATLPVMTDNTVTSRGLVWYDNRAMAVGSASCTGDWGKQVHAYDPCTDSWSNMPSLPISVVGAQPVVVHMTSAFPAP